MKCHKCDTEIVKPDSLGTGYAIDNQDNKICYDCCGKQDIEIMRITGKIGGYYCVPSVSRPRLHYGQQRTSGIDAGTFQNWPGTLKIQEAKSH